MSVTRIADTPQFCGNETKHFDDLQRVVSVDCHRASDKEICGDDAQPNSL